MFLLALFVLYYLFYSIWTIELHIIYQCNLFLVILHCWFDYFASLELFAILRITGHEHGALKITLELNFLLTLPYLFWLFLCVCDCSHYLPVCAPDFVILASFFDQHPWIPEDIVRTKPRRQAFEFGGHQSSLSWSMYCHASYIIVYLIILFIKVIHHVALPIF